ncbi:MAG TPA: hypothetical protein DCM86_01810, partial [Verrucomicrobiales bacterium]|nr:hypothetical protein [Verrucomicrobiales bacterium]
MRGAAHRLGVLGEYQADLLIEGCLIVEIKACRALVPEHT